MLKPLIQIALLCCLISNVYAAPFQKVEILDAIDRKAVCNDGSPGVYYFRPGSGSGATRWIILLRGGGFCNTPGCDGRDPSLMSSIDTEDTLDEQIQIGLLSESSTLNPDFYNFNMVVIHYCSSDLWSGNRFEPSGSQPLQFRGIKIFRAVIADLKNKPGINLLSPGTEVLLAGTSAGGVGVMVHLDWLSKKLRAAKVRGFNDSGWFPEQSSAVNPIFEAEIAKGISLWKGKPDSNCRRANRAKKSKCYLSTAFPYLTTPLFVAESQWDAIFVGDTTDPSADEFAKSVRDSLTPVHGAFSPRISIHPLSYWDLYYSLKVGKVTLRDVLGNWFFERAGKVKAIKK